MDKEKTFLELEKFGLLEKLRIKDLEIKKREEFEKYKSKFCKSKFDYEEQILDLLKIENEGKLIDYDYLVKCFLNIEDSEKLDFFLENFNLCQKRKILKLIENDIWKMFFIKRKFIHSIKKRI